MKRTTRRTLVVLVVLTTFTVQGCAYTERLIRKPWGWGTVIPGVVCGGIGAGTGWIIQNNRPGYSTIKFQDENGNPTRPDISVRDNKEQWKGALVGGVIGLVLCGVVGHALFDPEPTEPPPPPPPPPTPAPPPPVKKKIVLRGINFDFDKSDIRPDSQPVLDDAAATLRENPEIRVSVEGYTDSVGTDQYNQGLSERRANSVYRYLVAAGIAPDRMQVEGFGETHPVADNSTAAGRAENRRTELRVIGESGE